MINWYFTFPGKDFWIRVIAYDWRTAHKEFETVFPHYKKYHSCEEQLFKKHKFPGGEKFVI